MGSNSAGGGGVVEGGGEFTIFTFQGFFLGGVGGGGGLGSNIVYFFNWDYISNMMYLYFYPCPMPMVKTVSHKCS